MSHDSLPGRVPGVCAVFAGFSALSVLVALSLPCVVNEATAQAKTDASPTENKAPAARPSSAKWSVEDPPGPKRSVAINVNRGTWMTVSVHPSGTKLVFDLLGDLYELPIGGGKAKSLTSGMAWDMQPTYSPDGKHIAFTSDRRGGDNIFIASSDGTGVRPLTSETFRLLTQPVWTPDGRFVAARKHFTSRRSLGAGEIWLYYRTGGKGTQMTARKQQQKDLGEPAFSPDGRFLYYSRDATPGGHFEYGKDPNPQIFAIERVDRKTGRVEPFVGGPGGAVRPTPSPDGRHLAYLRRVRGKTVLYLRDLRSGHETALYNGMERDLQETWSIHGTYPGMSWLPDGKSLVFWAHGELLRAYVSGKITKIPFSLTDKREIRDALRFPVAVDPDVVSLKLLRNVRVSPDGKDVVFEALGRLWIRPLVGGKARRLTSQAQHATGQEQYFELMPAWSRDSKRIVFATWHDRLLGTLRVVGRSGGKANVVTDEPGHYVEPAFSPDGKALVFRRTGGGWLRSARWMQRTGVYIRDLKSGMEQRVARRGTSPHFGASLDRVYLWLADERGKGGKEAELRQKLVSVSRHDRRPRVHAVGKWATRAKVSPNGKWLAFQERFGVYLQPFSPTAKPLALAHDSKAWPTILVSADAGGDLHWSSQSDALRWSHGPKVFTRNVSDALAVLQDESEGVSEAALKRGGAPAPSIDLGFNVPAARHTGVAAIVGARLVTMNGSEVIEDGTVVWRGHRIVAVGARKTTAVPAGAKVFDGRGKTVIPGFVDVHAHGAQATGGITPQQNWGNLSMLSFGVTTLHDPSNRTADIFSAQQLQRAGKILAPRLFSTGTILYGARHFITADVASLDDAKRHLRRMKAVGAVSVKSYNQPRRDQRQMLLTAARELKMMVVPEGGALFMHNMTQVIDGHTGIEHALPIARGYDDVVQLWSGTKVGYTPTLGVAYGGLGAEHYWYAKTRVDLDKRLMAFVPPHAVEPRARRTKGAPDEEFNHIEASKFANRLMHKGVKVNLGAHGQREGLAVHWELWSLVQGGMTPWQALRACTLHSAHYLGMDGDIGSVKAGKLADFAVIDGNPLKDVRLSKAVRWTVQGGRVFDSATMNEVFPKPSKRPALFWKLQGEPRATIQKGGATVGCGCSAH